MQLEDPGDWRLEVTVKERIKARKKEGEEKRRESYGRMKEKITKEERMRE